MQDCLGFVVSQPSRRSASGEDDKLYPGASSVPTESYLCHVVQFAALETVSVTQFSEYIRAVFQVRNKKYGFCYCIVDIDFKNLIY